MSNCYTERMKGEIIRLIEIGDYSLKTIANACNVSVAFVISVRDRYDEFYNSILKENAVLHNTGQT